MKIDDFMTLVDRYAAYPTWTGKLPEYDDFEPRSEADAKAEFDEWMKQAIMDDKAQ